MKLLASVAITAILITTPVLTAAVSTTPNAGGQRLEQLWLITFMNQDGVEQVAQAKLQSGDFVPLIAIDQERLESIIEAASGIARTQNIKMKLIKFSERVDVGAINP